MTEQNIGFGDRIKAARKVMKFTREHVRGMTHNAIRDAYNEGGLGRAAITTLHKGAVCTRFLSVGFAASVVFLVKPEKSTSSQPAPRR